MKKITFAVLTTILIASSIKTKGQAYLPPHYLFPQFEEGSIKMKGGTIHNTTLDYNTVTEEMIYDDHGKKLALTNLENIDTIFLHQYKFIVFNLKFYDLAWNDQISLLISYKKKISEAGQANAYGTTTHTNKPASYTAIVSSGKIYDLKFTEDWNFEDATVYYILSNGNLNSFNNQRQFLKLFPDKAEELKTFIRKEGISFDNRNDLIKLIKHLNGK